MKTFTFTQSAMLVVALSASTLCAKAQKFEASAGGDIVSSYIWRGQDLGGVSIQPTASISASGFSLTAWGNVGFDSKDTKEFDFTFGYSKAGFNAGITDYWFNTVDNYFDYAAHTTAHMFEGTLGYDFGVAAIVWNTYFGGADYLRSDGKRAYSTYIEANTPFNLGGLDFNAELGLTPWEGLYSDKLNVVNIGIKVTKDVKITDTFSIPAFTKITFNPNKEKCYFVFGITL